MKIKYLLAAILGVMAIGRANGERPSVYSDTLAFRQYLSDNIGTRADKLAIFQLYHRLGLQVTREEKDKVYTDDPFYFDFGDDLAEFFLSIDKHCGIVKVPDIANWPSQLPPGHRDNYFFPDSLRSRLRKEFIYRAYNPQNREKDKEALIQALAAFDSVATNKPIFFAEIYDKFKGDYRKYVNRLYKKSILLNNSRMMKFTLRPTRKKLQADLGVQFVIGLALYESWIKDVREGHVTDGVTGEKD